MGIGGIMGTIIHGINWGTRTFNLNDPEAPQDETIPEPIIEPPPPKEPEKPKKEVDVIEVAPGEPMPEGYPDYREILQRDGLFVYYYAIWKEQGLIVVYWLRTHGKIKQYASGFCAEQDLATAMPTRTADWRHWTELNNERPDCAIYAAPQNIDSYGRPAYLTKLRDHGVSINFDYDFTLAKQRNNVEMPKPFSVTERLIDLLKQNTPLQIATHPETCMDRFVDFVAAICADGTVDRWNMEKAKKRRRV
jgi:hypothetical protein